jgi:hypothetical protein
MFKLFFAVLRFEFTRQVLYYFSHTSSPENWYLLKVGLTSQKGIYEK